jgi:phage baseplate assembly protein W
MPGVPHFTYPFRVGQRVATVEQGTVDEVITCVYAIMATEVGSRAEEPEFGVLDQAFKQGGASFEDLETAVAEWEPRAVTALDSEAWDELTERVRIAVGVET